MALIATSSPHPDKKHTTKQSHVHQGALLHRKVKTIEKSSSMCFFQIFHVLWTHSIYIYIYIYMHSPPVEFRTAPRTANSKGAWHNCCLISWFHHCTWMNGWPLQRHWWRWDPPRALSGLDSMWLVYDLKNEATWCALPKPLPQQQQNNTWKWSWISPGRLWHPQERSTKLQYLFCWNLRSGKFTKLQRPKKKHVLYTIRNDPVWYDSNMTHLLASSCRAPPKRPGSPLRTPSCNGVCPWPSSASQAHEMEQLPHLWHVLLCPLSKSLGNTKGPILYSQRHPSFATSVVEIYNIVRVRVMWLFCRRSPYPLRIVAPHGQHLWIISTLSNICPRF